MNGVKRRHEVEPTEVPEAGDGLEEQQQPLAQRPRFADGQDGRSKSPNLLPQAFSRNATLVLVGVRGSGKSTLAVMASSALGRRVLDLEVLFQKTHGKTTSQLKQEIDPDQCTKLQLDLAKNVLEQNKKGKIIVSSWMDRGMRLLLEHFCHRHPVVFIAREKEAIQQHLQISDDAKANTLLSVCREFYEQCTNLEFFNMSESIATPGNTSQTAFMTLKRTERHWLTFLSRIYPSQNILHLSTLSPMNEAPLFRHHTYIVCLELDVILQQGSFVENCDTGADAIQINVRQDSIENISKGLAIVRKGTVLPVAIHIVLPNHAGSPRLEAYSSAVMKTLRLAPDIITLDLRLSSESLSKIAGCGNQTKLIGFRESQTDKEHWGHDIWIQTYKQAATQRLDALRLVRNSEGRMTGTEYSAAGLQERLLNSPGPDLPVSVYDTGKDGRSSACRNTIMTPVASMEAPFNAQDYPDSPYITAKDATKSLYASFTLESMKLYVIGASVNYSMSPIMHNAALDACGIPHHYSPFSCPTLEHIKHLIYDRNFGGASIGLPFKVEVIKLTSYLGRHAQAIGAVNTLIPIRDIYRTADIPADYTDIILAANISGPVAGLYGDNTDWIGIRSCIHRGLSPANAVRPGTCGVIIGAGGMARAATYAMLQVGVKNIVVYNRTAANAEKLVDHFETLLGSDTAPDLGLRNDTGQTTFHILQDLNDPWPANMAHPTIIISCIPTHTIGDEPAPNFRAPDSWLLNPNGGVVVELGYKTLNTPLLEQARQAASRGWLTMDGLDLLPEQGYAQFELFTGRRAPRGVMRAELFKRYCNEQGESDLPELRQRLQRMTDSST